MPRPTVSPKPEGATLDSRCPPLRRWLSFSMVGAMGVVVQAGTLACLMGANFAGSGPHYLLATAIAVEAAVLHNFAWHWRWTWADRAGTATAGTLSLLLRYHLTTGLFSLAGNLLFMRLLVGTVGLDVFLANLLSIAFCWVVNFMFCDRFVFASP